MTSAMVNPPDRHGATPDLLPRAHRPSDLAWVTLVSAADVLLRRWYGVHAFTDDPACLLRIGRIEAPHGVTLRDGTTVQAGDPIAILHFWNERLPRFSAVGPDLGWATTFRQRMDASLRALCRYLAADRSWDDVAAIHACVNFGSRRRRWQIRRAAARFGFELIPTDIPPGLHELGEDMFIWALTRAFNPRALRNHSLRRDRTELWILRASLFRLYG